MSQSCKIKVDNKKATYATGKRKRAIARVWIQPGKGSVYINKQTIDQYVDQETLKMIINQPFNVTGTVNNYDVIATCIGGGISGQADAIKHGISKCLALISPEQYVSTLRQHGLLTRDSRVVERKKPGQRKARKLTQFSKR